MRNLTEGEITSLAEKKLAGTITASEEAQLKAWVTRAPPHEIFWDSTDEDEISLRNRLLEGIQRDAGIGRRRTRIRAVGLLRAAAAAVFLLIAGMVGYRYVSGVGTAEGYKATTASVIKDLPPGHQGAVLTLGNGHKIVLDSAGNGNLAVQGTLRLIKRNGLLAYEKGSGSAVQTPVKLTNTLTTPRGREFEIVLSDGTRVWLNAASSITYPSIFNDDVRKVSITGEAYFEVAKDEKRPFIVSVDAAEIAVLGTHFDVMAYPDEKSVKTTLLEGSVKVTRAKKQVIVTPGQQASFSRHSEGISLKMVDAVQSVAWVKGKLSLDNLGIKAIMRQVSRWYDVNVDFEGPIPEERFWGVINRNVNLSSVLDVMKANGINARLQDGTIIISSN